MHRVSSSRSANRYLIKVAPGVRNQRVTMKQSVEIEGAGELEQPSPHRPVPRCRPAPRYKVPVMPSCVC